MKRCSDYILKINKRNEIYRLLEIVEPYVYQIPNMRYKIEVDSKLIDTHRKFVEKYKDKIINIPNNEVFDNTYSDKEESRIIIYLMMGLAIKIFLGLGRTNSGLYDKIKKMEEKGLI